MKKNTTIIVWVIPAALALIVISIFLYPIVGRWLMFALEKERTRVVLQVEVSDTASGNVEQIRDQALVIIERRVSDFLGMARPDVAGQGTDQIVVEFLGDCDSSRIEFVSKTAALEFKLLPAPEDVQRIIDRIDLVLKARDTTVGVPTLDVETDFRDNLGDGPFSSLLEPVGGWFGVVKEDEAGIRQWFADPDIQKVIPPQVQVAWGIRTRYNRGRELKYLYFLNSDAELNGNCLADARPAFDQFRKPVVDFTLTEEGGRAFARMTSANIGNPVAIVLDNRVVSSPTIEGRIPDCGTITLGGGEYEEAVELAVLLRAGALPAPLRVVDYRVIRK